MWRNMSCSSIEILKSYNHLDVASIQLRGGIKKCKIIWRVKHDNEREMERYL